MKKALIIGGNSGVGFAMIFKLLKEDYTKIYVLGKDEPDLSLIEAEMKDKYKEKVFFSKINLIFEDFSVLSTINDIDTLIITAGFGRVALLSDLTGIEVNNLLKVNLNACVRVLKHYYPQIASNKDFYTAVMVSISGRVVSPLLSVYGAAKAGLRYFIENVNAELGALHIPNRILEVSPGFLKGTNFYGKGTDVSLLEETVDNIYAKMMSRVTLFIPQYEETYKNVIEKYNSNPIQFGLDSFNYKIANDRSSKNAQVTIGFLSGTFDLFHIGHLNLLRRAKEQCDYLIVSVHVSGAWKGKETFIPYEERRTIVESVRYVDEVVEDFLEDADAWEKFHYNKLFVGSDYKGTERFNRYEKLLFGKAEIVYFPYTQGTSSTQLREVLRRGQ